jgi:DNA-binding response OmpR family regulator
VNAHPNDPHASPFSALVVEPNERDAIFIVSALTSVGFTVTLADNFQSAKSLLISDPPLVLITEIRLGPYNGLQLALRTATATVSRRVTVVVTSAFADPVLQRDAESVGATFVVKPVTAPELIAAVYRTALRRPNADGTLDPVRAPFERRQGERRNDILAMIESERRYSDRRRDIAALMIRAASLS